MSWEGELTLSFGGGGEVQQCIEKESQTGPVEEHHLPVCTCHAACEQNILWRTDMGLIGRKSHVRILRFVTTGEATSP